MGISTHILDIARGKPAANIETTLEMKSANGQWQLAHRAKTNDDGRIKNLAETLAHFEAGIYRLHFAVGEYLQATHGQGFYPEVVISFEVTNPQEHFHVPLLLSPFGFSTYRGS